MGRGNGMCLLGQLRHVDIAHDCGVVIGLRTGKGRALILHNEPRAHAGPPLAHASQNLKKLGCKDKERTFESPFTSYHGHPRSPADSRAWRWPLSHRETSSRMNARGPVSGRGRPPR